MYPPAIYASSVDVGATDSNNNIASFSSRGPVTSDGSHRTKPDVSAPGVSVRGAVPGNGYQSGWSGTSMAAPHVAGGVALLWQANPALIGNIGKTESNMEHAATHLTDAAGCRQLPRAVSLPGQHLRLGIAEPAEGGTPASKAVAVECGSACDAGPHFSG